MGMMMAVSFERYGRLYYLDPGPYCPKVGDKVLVPTDAGPEVAECIWAPQWVSEDLDGLPECAGLAAEDDLARGEMCGARRGEARLQGGIGPCGRDLCCATFLRDFEPVSVRMAKDQDLPVNPMRIAGACGRLMCCLKYEHPLYAEFKKNAPRAGTQVDTPGGPGIVAGHSVPTDKVVVKLDEDGRRCACSRASVCGPRQAYEGAHGSGSGGS